MGVDLSRMKEFQAEAEAKHNKKPGSSFTYWNPKSEKNRIRLMPPWTSEGNWRDSFFREAAMHWGVGTEEEKLHFACPTRSKFGPEVQSKACPICAQVDRLKNNGNPADAEYANDLRARTRYYSNVVDLNDPVYTSKDVAEWQSKQNDKTRECPFAAGDTKVQVFSYGPMIFEELLSVFADQGIDITDFNTGHDILITREGSGRTTKYKTRPDFQPTPFKFVSSKPYREVLPNLDNIVQFQPLQNLQAALDGVPAAQILGAPQSRSAPSLPAATQRTAPQLPPTQKQLSAPPPVEESEGPPHCFQDRQTCDPNDAECVGGVKNGQEYDQCPWYKDCHSAKFGAVQKAPSRRSAKPAAPAPSAGVPSAIEALEAELKKALT